MICLDRFFSTGQGSIEKNMFSYCLNNPTIYYNGSVIRQDDIGNIHYGYVRRELFDDPRDQFMVIVGTILWVLSHAVNGGTEGLD